MKVYKQLIVWHKGHRFYYNEASYIISGDFVEVYEDGDVVGIFHRGWAIEVGEVMS